MKNSSLKKVWLFFSSMFIFLLHLPFVFAKNKPADEIKPTTANSVSWTGNNFLSIVPIKKTANAAGAMYDSLRLKLMGLSQQTFELAMQGFDCIIDSATR